MDHPMPFEFTLAGDVRVPRKAHAQLTCDQCGAVFFRPRSKVKGGRDFCSWACRYRISHLLELHCQTCGRSFSRLQSQVTGARSYCSNACRGIGLAVPISERFWRYVRKTDGCWLWLGTTDADGYGLSWVDGKNVRAHRLSYEMAYGPIMDDRRVLHACDTPPCVRPEHLSLGTNADNVADMMAKGRQRVGEQVWKAKLTADAVLAIRARYAAGGVSHLALAAEYGVAEGTVQKVLKRKTWKHLE